MAQCQTGNPQRETWRNPHSRMEEIEVANETKEVEELGKAEHSQSKMVSGVYQNGNSLLLEV